jgi:hypothetical protein
VHGQLERAVAYGLSAALLEELSVKDGTVQQSNFNDYQVLRMSDLSEIRTKIVTTDNLPIGMGEIGVVTVAPALRMQSSAYRLAVAPFANVGGAREGAKDQLAIISPRRAPIRNAAGFVLLCARRRSGARASPGFPCCSAGVLSGLRRRWT